MKVRLRGRSWGVSAVLLAAVSAAIGSADEPTGALTWDDNQGVMWNTLQAVLRLDASQQRRGPIIRVAPDGDEYRLVDPEVEQISPTQLALAYQLSLPGGPAVSIRRDITVRQQADGMGLVEIFTILAPQPWAADVEIERPFTVQPGGTRGQGKIVWPLKNGWARAPAAALPQWFEVTFPQPRSVSRLVVITYEKDGTAETAGKWGIQDYQLQLWEVGQNAWKTVVTEHRGRAVKTRVHDLPQPLETSKIRLLVQRVAPLDGQARLLQLEAWGPTR